MRVLHVINTYAPVTNGVTVSVAGWAEALRHEGHEVGIWTIGRPTAGDVEHGVSRVPGFGRLAPGFPIPSTFAPPREVSTKQWDVVHAHHPVLLGPAAARFARHVGAVFVATAHSDYLGYLCDYPLWARRMIEPIACKRMRQFFGHADGVFAPSHSIETALATWGVEPPFMPTSYPVDVSALGVKTRAEARARLGIGSDVPLAVYVGRLAPDKRVFRLLDEFAVTRASRPDARLVLVGGGPQAAAVRARARRFGDAVVCTGALETSELGSYYSAADAFVSASRNEVGPLAAIEAALCGTAAVAFTVPGFVDRVVDGTTGLLAADSPGELGRRLAELLSDRERASRMGAAAQKHMCAHTPGESARLLARGYEHALAASRAMAERAGISTHYEAERT